MRTPIAPLAALLAVFAASYVVTLQAADEKTQIGATLMGCLEKAGSGDSYVLNSGTGDGTVIAADTKLENHIGHTVKLTGKETQTAGHPVFTVHDIQHIANTCSQPETGAERIARAEFRNPGNKVIGEATLLQSNKGVLIKATFTKLPAGKHALHVHETGSCEAPEFKSAGGHFNPENAEHGLTDPKGPHAGDMPNFTAARNGETVVEVFNERVTLAEGAGNSLLKPQGTALVVHAGTDDYKTDPAGDAGKRIACAVIEATQPGSVQAKQGSQ
jgi:Cu-Zn family superoxide dismutase